VATESQSLAPTQGDSALASRENAVASVIRGAAMAIAGMGTAVAYVSAGALGALGVFVLFFVLRALVRLAMPESDEENRGLGEIP
jgi:hypothetical protein